MSITPIIALVVALGVLFVLQYLIYRRGESAGTDPGHDITEVSYSLYGGNVGTVLERDDEEYRVTFDADPAESSHLVCADTWLRPGERVEVVDKDAVSGQLIVDRVDGETADTDVMDIEARTGSTEAYVIETLDGTPVEFTVAPVVEDQTAPLSHEDGSVVATLREIVDEIDEDWPLTTLDDRDPATRCAHEHGLWIANVRALDTDEPTPQRVADDRSDTATDPDRELH